MIESGLLLFAAILAVMAKMPRSSLQKLLGYDYYVDAIASVFVMWVFFGSGTYSGMMTAAIATLALSLAMALAKRIVGFQRYSRKHRQWEFYMPAWRHRV